VLTKRGKSLQKHYTVFVCGVEKRERESYKPVLNEEHSEWKWMPATELRTRQDMHPVTEQVLCEHWETVQPWILHNQ
jgi:hypothetical protein